MYTVTKDRPLATTVTGSWPRPTWFDKSMWGRPLSACMMDAAYREQFTDALTAASPIRSAPGSTSSRRATSSSTPTWPGARGTTTRCSAGSA